MVWINVGSSVKVIAIGARGIGFESMSVKSDLVLPRASAAAMFLRSCVAHAPESRR